MKEKLYKTRLYEIWRNIKTRCYNKKYKRYYDYGGRGITLCDKWLNNFKTFYDWSIQNGYTDKLTIDRINNNGNYCPENCRWVTPKTNSANRRNNLNFKYNGKEQCLKIWAEELNIDYFLLYSRIIRRKWDFEKAIKTPIMENMRNRNAKIYCK